MDYVVLGCLSIDNIINAQGIKKLKQFGGNAAYGAAGMNLWKPGSIGVVSRMGTDIPVEWLEQMKKSGIDVEGIRSVGMRHMMFSGMVYDEYGDRNEVVFNEDLESEESGLIKGFPVMTPKMVKEAHENFAPTIEDIPASYRDAKAVMIAARHFDRQLAYAQYFRKYNPDVRIVMDTGNDYMKPQYKNELSELFSLVDVIIPSETEARALFGEECDLEAAVIALTELGAKAAVIKVGKQGCIIYDSVTHKMVHVPVYAANVQDPTGAGDSFCGGFTVGLNETNDLVQAAMYGTVSASFIIENFGVTPTLEIKREMAEQRLELLKTR